jgi:transposase
MCWRQTRKSGKKKQRIKRSLGRLRKRSIVLVEDETDLLHFPPLRAMWSPRGTSASVMLSGANIRRVVYGCMSLHTGHRLFHVSRRQRAADFQTFLRLVRRHYRGWHVVMLLDNDTSHTAKSTRDLARCLGIRLVWLPKRAPELNPMESLWAQGKKAASTNWQYRSIEEHVTAFLNYVKSLSDAAARRVAGILSKHFWLRRAASNHFCAHA